MRGCSPQVREFELAIHTQTDRVPFYRSIFADGLIAGCSESGPSLRQYLPD